MSMLVVFVYKLLFGLTALQADDFSYCVSLHVLEANHPYKLFYHDVQLIFVSVFSPTASLKPGMSFLFTPILLASIYLNEHLRVLTLLLTVTFKSRFYRFLCNFMAPR